jgi:hypothetical protein
MYLFLVSSVRATLSGHILLDLKLRGKMNDSFVIFPNFSLLSLYQNKIFSLVLYFLTFFKCLTDATTVTTAAVLAILITIAFGGRPNIAVEWLELLLCIWDIPDSGMPPPTGP